MAKTAMNLAEKCAVLLAVVVAYGCTPYRLEVGPYFVRDDTPDRFETLVEAVLAEHLDKVSRAEQADGGGKDGRIALAQHTATEKDLAADGQDATVDAAAARSASHNDVGERAPHASPPARFPLGADEYMERARPPTTPSAAASREESVIASLDRELQLLRTERQSLRLPRDELLQTTHQAKDLSAAEGNILRKAGEPQRRQLNDLLSRLAAQGLKRKADNGAPRQLASDTEVAKQRESARSPTGGSEPTASPTDSQSARNPIGQGQPLGKPTVPIATAPDSPFASGKDLFRAGDYDGALIAFRKIDLNGLSEANRLLVRYLTATCLRKQGRLKEAEAEYTVVANSRADAVLADNARWQLGTIRWRRDLEGQISKLRQLQKNPSESL